MRKLRFHLVNLLLFVFGSSFLKKVRAKLLFWRANIKQHRADTRFVENNMHMMQELKVKAESLGRMDFRNALEECSSILDKK